MFGRFAGEEQGNAVKEVLGTNNPSKRIADPKEIAKLAVYLASDDSAYVVGADFLIDGGSRPFRPWRLSHSESVGICIHSVNFAKPAHDSGTGRRSPQ